MRIPENYYTLFAFAPSDCRNNPLSNYFSTFIFITEYNFKVGIILNQNNERINNMQKITPFLWFNNNAEEAVEFYTSVFKDSKVLSMSRYSDDAHGRKGSVMTIEFLINGQEFVALNGGPEFSFTPAVSFFIKCQDQQEVDYYWDKLSAGGQIMECGWLQDKFGVSWQVVPVTLQKLLNDKDPAKAQRVTQALYKMKKLDIAALEKAYNGG